MLPGTGRPSPRPNRPGCSRQSDAGHAERNQRRRGEDGGAAPRVQPHASSEAAAASPLHLRNRRLSAAPRLAPNQHWRQREQAGHQEPQNGQRHHAVGRVETDPIDRGAVDACRQAPDVKSPPPALARRESPSANAMPVQRRGRRRAPAPAPAAPRRSWKGSGAWSGRAQRRPAWGPRPRSPT